MTIFFMIRIEINQRITWRRINFKIRNIFWFTFFFLRNNTLWILIRLNFIDLEYLIFIYFCFNYLLFCRVCYFLYFKILIFSIFLFFLFQFLIFAFIWLIIPKISWIAIHKIILVCTERPWLNSLIILLR